MAYLESFFLLMGSVCKFLPAVNAGKASYCSPMNSVNTKRNANRIAIDCSNVFSSLRSKTRAQI